MKKHVIFLILFSILVSFSHGSLYSPDAGTTTILPFEKRSPFQQKTIIRPQNNVQSNPFTLIVGIGLGIYELGKYSVLIEGENGIVTALKNISEKSLNKLAKNYGWN